MYLYSDFITVKSDFIPVFNQEADRTNPRSWKSFIPHEGFRNLLETVHRALDRGRVADKRSIWMQGAYGTGKTFASFVIKHLLEEPLEEVSEFLTRQDLLKPFWRKFEALRGRGNFLTVYRSSVSHVNSPIKLLAEIQTGIRQALKTQGFTSVAPDIYDKVIEQLEGKGAIHWENVFSKYQLRFRAYGSHEEIIEALQSERLKERPERPLLAEVVDVLSEEGFVVMDSPEDVKAWCREIINKNGLQGVIFIWDEFTDFFSQRGIINTLQELSHATTEIPFYLFLITHRRIEQIGSLTNEDRRKIEERFHAQHFEMQPVTAYKLLGNAIETKESRKDDWESKKETLWQGVKEIASYLLQDEAATLDFKGLLPIHPYSAFYLATISQQFSSSQRSLFQFLQGEGKGGFEEFISGYPDDQWHWLTPDLIWDYFFENEEVRSELAEASKAIVGYCQIKAQGLTDPVEKRLFKTVMLLSALSREIPGENRLRPTKNNLRHAFEGQLSSAEVEKTLHDLCDQYYIHAIPYHGDEEFTVPLLNIDQQRLSKIREDLKNTRFEDKVSEGFASTLGEAFTLFGAIAQRHGLRVIALGEMEKRREHVLWDIKPYQIATIAVVALRDEEISRAEALCGQLSGKLDNCVLLVMQYAFGQKRWEDWLDREAYRQYCEETGDHQNKLVYEKEAKLRIDDFKKAIRDTTHKAYFKGEEKAFSGLDGYRRLFSEFAERVFPYGPEKITDQETLYTGACGKASAEYAIGTKTPNKQYSTLIEKLSSFEKADGYSSQPDHPLSRAKEAVCDSFEDRSELSLSETWALLQEPPFGFFESPIGLVVFAFLLKDYCKGHYWSDGVNCHPLNENKLAELVEIVCKGRRNAEQLRVRKMTDQDEAFCLIVHKIFDLPHEKCAYPDEARKALRLRLQAIGCPIWALKYQLRGEIEKELSQKIEMELVQGLEILLREDEGWNQGYEFMQTVITLGGFLISKNQVYSEKIISLFDGLRGFCSSSQFETGMLRFFEEAHPPLKTAMDEGGWNLKWATGKLKSLLNEEVWLWKEEVVKEKLEEVEADARLIQALNDLSAKREEGLDSALRNLKTEWLPRRSHLPLFVLAYGVDSPVKEGIHSLGQLVKDKERLNVKERLELARIIQKDISGFRDAIGSQRAALREWVGEHLGCDLSEFEAEELIGEIQPCTNIEEDELRSILKEQIEALKTFQLKQELKGRWKELTQSESPGGWSSAHRVPVRWLLSRSEFEDLFDILEEKRDMPLEDDLKASLDLLERYEADIRRLCDHAWVNERFLEIVAPHFADMIKDQIEGAKDHLVATVGTRVIEWTNQLPQVQKAMEAWIEGIYQEKLFQLVAQRIEAMPEIDAKKFLIEIAQEAAIGALLFQRLKTKG